MNEFRSLVKTMIDFVFDRHHYILVSIFVLFIVFLIIVVGTNSNLMPYPIPKDKLELHRQMGQVVGVAKAVYFQMVKDGELMPGTITFGADWKTFRDYPHIQRKYD